MAETEAERLARLESRADNADARMFSVDSTLKELLKRTADIQLSLAGRRECPEPGACLELRPRIHALEGRLTAIEVGIERARGFALAVKLAWLGIGGAAGFILSHYIHP